MVIGDFGLLSGSKKASSSTKSESTNSAKINQQKTHVMEGNVYCNEMHDALHHICFFVDLAHWVCTPFPMERYNSEVTQR